MTSDCVCRSVTKEEKEKENTRKVAPAATMTMPPAGRPSSVQARPMHGLLPDDPKAVGPSSTTD